jgi:hypothetical protein
LTPVPNPQTIRIVLNAAIEGGRRADAVNSAERNVIELNATIPERFERGLSQGSRYVDELTKQYPGPSWSGQVTTYKP